MSYVATEWVAHETKVTAAAMNNIEGGITDNETAIAALSLSKINISQGAGNAGKAFIVGQDGNATLGDVVSLNQGIANAGKAMIVGQDGALVPTSIESTWTYITSEDAELNSNLELFTSEDDSWSMCYSSKLQLFSFDAKLVASDDLTGGVIVANVPVDILEDGVVIENDSGFIAAIYDGKIRVFSDWASGTSVRFHVMCHYFPS